MISHECLEQFLPVRRYAGMGISCHRVSVCVSLCHMPVLYQILLNVGSRKQHHVIAQESLVDDSLFPEICAQSDPPPFQTPHFRPVSTHSASTVTAGEKVQLALIGSRPHAFQRAIDEPCTLPLSPPKSGTKHVFAVFASKIQLL